eukprot:g4623.t1
MSESEETSEQAGVHGWLMKRAIKSGRNWRRRYFVLNLLTRRLCWWKKELSKDQLQAFLDGGGSAFPAPRGIFTVFKVCVLECFEDGDPRLPANAPARAATLGMGITSPSTGATLYIVAETEADRKRWARAVRTAIGGEEALRGGPDWLGFDLGDEDNAICSAAYSSAAYMGETLAHAEGLGAWANLHSAAVVGEWAEAGRHVRELGAVIARAPTGAADVLRDLREKVHDLHSRIGIAQREHPQAAVGADAQAQHDQAGVDAAISASWQEHDDGFEDSMVQAMKASADSHRVREDVMLARALSASSRATKLKPALRKENSVISIVEA